MTSLHPTWIWGDLDLTDAPFAMEREGNSVNHGAPVTATEALAQLLQDGEIEVGPRASNRTLEFTMYITDDDLLDLANAEAQLAIEADKPRNTLAYNPGDEWAPTTVFDTYRAQLTFVRSDAAEASGLRQYDVVMKAAPFGRSATEVITEAESASTEPPTTINAGTDPAGWLGMSTLTDLGTYLRASSGRPPAASVIYTPAVPLDLSATRYVSLVMWDFVGSPSMSLNGEVATVPLIGSEPSTTPGRTRYIWQVPAATVATTMTFRTPSLAFNFNLLQRTDAAPAIGTTRQKMRSVEVVGSARTQGSLAVEHETSALGSTLVYTWPAVLSPSYSPPLRALRTSGGTVATDSSLVSGARDLLDTALVYDVPASSLIAGTHLLIARVRSDTNGDQTINYTAQTRQGSTNIGTATTGSLVVPFSTNPTTWRNVVLGRLMLPAVDVPSSSTAVVRITLVAASPGTSNIDLDETWVFNTSVGQLSWVECGTASPSEGGSSNRLWLETATTDRPRPTIYRGFDADGSDAYYPGADVLSFGVHEFAPPLMNVFTVTSNALDAAVTLRHYPRWHTHAAT